MTPLQEKLYRRAFAKLSCRDMTPQGLYLWLMDTKEPVEPDLAKAVVRQLAAEGFLNQERSYQLLLAQAKNRLWGPRKLAQELRARHFSQAYRQRLAEEEINYDQQARQLARQLGAPGQDAASQRRLYARLTARGYTGSQAAQACEYWQQRTQQEE